MRLLTESSAPIKVWMSAFAISDTSSFQENAARLSIAVQNRQPMVAFLGRRQFSNLPSRLSMSDSIVSLAAMMMSDDQRASIAVSSDFWSKHSQPYLASHR